jgi:hypothetical protein
VYVLRITYQTISEEVEEASKIFIQATHNLSKLLSYEKYSRRDR